MRALNAEGYEKCNFRPIYHFNLEMTQDGAMVTMEWKFWGWPLDPLGGLGLRGCKALPLIGIGMEWQ